MAPGLTTRSKVRKGIATSKNATSGSWPYLLLGARTLLVTIGIATSKDATSGSWPYY